MGRPVHRDRGLRGSQQQKVEHGDTDGVEDDREVRKARCLLVLTAAALDAQVVAHEALDVRWRARQGRVVTVVLRVYVELDARPRPEGSGSGSGQSQG